MGKASKIMYTIGVVFNIVEIVLTVLFVILGLVGMANPEAMDVTTSLDGGRALTTAEKQVFYVTFFVIALVMLIIAAVVLILALRARKKVGDGVKNNGPHIMMIVIGAISGDVFYLLGGIFGLVAEQSEGA